MRPQLNQAKPKQAPCHTHTHTQLGSSLGQPAVSEGKSALASDQWQQPNAFRTWTVCCLVPQSKICLFHPDPEDMVEVDSIPLRCKWGGSYRHRLAWFDSLQRWLCPIDSRSSAKTTVHILLALLSGRPVGHGVDGTHIVEAASLKRPPLLHTQTNCSKSARRSNTT